MKLVLHPSCKVRFEKQDTLNGQGTNQRRNNNTSESNIKHTTSRSHATKHDHLNTHTHAAHFCVCPFLHHVSTRKTLFAQVFGARGPSLKTQIVRPRESLDHNDNFVLPLKNYRSMLVCGTFGQTEGFHSDSSAVDVDSKNFLCSSGT